MVTKRFFAMMLCVLLLCGQSVCAEGVRIGFLDSGVSVKHIAAEGVATGENMVFPTRDTDDRIGHGTATAGIVLGSEKLGLNGVCPSAVVVPLVCFDVYPTGIEAPADVKYMAAAIRAAVDKYDCRIINISMGTTEDSAELRAAVEYASECGALIVSAVGNDNLTNPERTYYPAKYEKVIGVGAADGNKPAKFSQRNGVDILAQGVELPTVTRQNAERVELRSGSSYACAYISGLCAEIWSKNPEFTAEQVRKALFHSARDIGEIGFDRESGWGIAELECDKAEHSGEVSIYALSALRWKMKKGMQSGDESGFAVFANRSSKQLNAVTSGRLAVFE